MLRAIGPRYGLARPMKVPDCENISKSRYSKHDTKGFGPYGLAEVVTGSRSFRSGTNGETQENRLEDTG